MNVLPSHAVDDNSEAPLEVRPHWRIIGDYRLMFGGTQITMYLPRHNRVMKVLPGHAVDDNSEAPLEVRLHWRIIGNYQ